MKVGRKFSFDIVKLDDIIASVKKAKGSIGQIADLNHIPRQTFRDWIRTGEEDRVNCIDSDVAQFSCKLKYTQAIVIMDMVEIAAKNPRKAKFITWWLSKVCREDFAMDGFEYKELLEMYIKLREDFNRMQDRPLQGAMNHGRELDSVSDQKAGKP
jgi:hypothetical protein